MTQGITSLPGAQQAPGQAAMPQVTPAPQANTAGIAQTPALSQQSTDALLAMYRNPRLLEGTPYSLYGVIGALAQQIKAEAAAKAAKDNAVMAAYGQQAQQPPVAEGLAQQAATIAFPTQMARHGGEMHGYAGGGAVAFQSGGTARGAPFFNDVGIFPVSTDMNPGETREEYIERKRKEAAESQEMGMKGIERLLRSVFPESKLRRALYPDTAPPVEPGTEGYSHEALVGLRSKPQPPAPVVAAPPLPPSGAPRTGAAESTAPAPTAAPTGLNALMAQLFKQATTPNAELARIGKESEKNTQEMAALLQRLQGVSPEEAEARRQFYETMQGAYAPQRKALEEAKAAQERGLLQSPEALARLAAAFGGAKRVGQGLSAAAGAAGEFMGEQRKRVERLSENYDTLSAQLNMTLAQARLADAQNDEKRKRELLLQAQGLKDRLLATQMDLLKTGTEMRRGDISGLASLYGVQAQMMQAGKPTDFQQRLALFRSDPKAYEAMFGSKEAQMMTRVQQVTNTDPLLKELASKASMNLPGALEQYNARYRELIAQHAPELLLAGTGGAPGGGALSAATNIVRGGQQ